MVGIRDAFTNRIIIRVGIRDAFTNRRIMHQEFVVILVTGTKPLVTGSGGH